MIKYLAGAALVALGLSCGERSPEAAVPPPPNIVLILTDDQGWGDLSHNGNTNLATPHIDRLAANGVTFDRFFVSPVCSPTRAEILTGRYAVRGGVYSTSAGGERLDLDEVTIADILREAGYATGAFGKWHNGMQYPYHPNGRGFDEFYGFCSGHWGNYFSPMLEHNGEIVTGEGFVIDDFTDQAMDFIEANRDRPFFAYLPYNTPHSPMQVPEEYWARFADKELELRHREPEKENPDHLRAALAMCENIDWNVGRLMDKLDALSLLENTIVLYLSDNGPNGWRWNGDMKGRKGSTDEGGLRSPLSIQWRGTLPASTRVAQIASSLDLLPTLLDLANNSYDHLKALDGISLRPLLLDAEAEWADRTIVSHWRGRTSVRSQRYRLDHQNALFDMVADPGQREDVAAKYPSVHTALQQVKDEWAQQVLVELPDDDLRTFPVGHPDFAVTQIPARDGQAHGGVKRSNRFPNCTFFTNWTEIADKITWDVEVIQPGDFEVTIYYTCPAKDVGATFALSAGQQSITARITDAHDPPLTGMEHDRDARIESYVKDFKPLNLGQISLQQGVQILSLQATDIPGDQVMDFRLMLLRRVS